jgi:hypothetical protein
MCVLATAALLVSLAGLATRNPSCVKARSRHDAHALLALARA